MYLKSEVYSVKRKEGEHSSLWGPRAAEYHIGLAATQPHVLWSVGEVVNDPGGKMTGQPPLLPTSPSEVLAGLY